MVGPDQAGSTRKWVLWRNLIGVVFVRVGRSRTDSVRLINPCAVWLWQWINCFIYIISIISKADIINSTVYNFLSTNLTAALEKQNIEHHRFITSVLLLLLAEFENINPQGGFFKSIRDWIDSHGRLRHQWDRSITSVLSLDAHGYCLLFIECYLWRSYMEGSK